MHTLLRFVSLALPAVFACGRIGFDGRDDGTRDSGGSASSDASNGGGDAAPGSGSFGQMQIGVSTQNTGADRVWMSRFTLAEPAQVQTIVAHLGPTGSQTSTVHGVIYTDASGTPTTLRGTTTDVTVLGSSQPAWVSMPFSAPVSLAPGMYWIGTHNATQLSIQYQSATGATKFTGDIFSDGTDATYAGGATTYSMVLSIYADYAR